MRTKVIDFYMPMTNKAAPNLKSPAEVNAEFDRAGVSKAAWARAHKVSRAVVYQVLAGKKKGLRGESHKVAVLLGLKRGRLGVLPSDMASSTMKDAA